MQLTQSQVKSLILNAYGFVDQYTNFWQLNVAYDTQDGLFMLFNPVNHDQLTFWFDDSTIDLELFQVSFRMVTGEPEVFTVLNVPNGKSLPELLV